MRIIFAVFIILFPGLIGSSTYYVSNQGSNSNTGLYPDSAWETLQYASDQVVGGDTVLVLNGNYTGFDLRTSGNPSDPIVFKALDDSVIIDDHNPVTNDGINIENASWVNLEGFRIVNMPRAGIRAVVGSNITIRNNFCHQNYRWGIFTGFVDSALIEYNECCHTDDEHGIYFSNSGDYPVIRYNICHHNSCCGIHMNGDESMGGDGLISFASVEGNIIYENGATGGSGINCDGVAQSVIFNNLLFFNHASGISLYRIDASAGSYQDRIFNNTIIQADDARWALNINTESVGDTVYNNILLTLHSYRGSISIDSSSLPGFHSDYNLVNDRMTLDQGNTVISLAQWQNMGYDQHSWLAGDYNSIFVNYPSNDFHLKSTSTAVDNGTSMVNPPVGYDLDSIIRPQGSGFDIGAYEYSSTGVENLEIFDLDETIRFVPRGSQLIFSGLPSCSQIMIIDICGRILHQSDIISDHSYIWQDRQPHSGLLFIIIRDLNSSITQGKILILD